MNDPRALRPQAGGVIFVCLIAMVAAMFPSGADAIPGYPKVSRDYGEPDWLLKPRWGMDYPWGIVLLGMEAEKEVMPRIKVRAGAAYGLNMAMLDASTDDEWGAPFFEAYAGYVFSKSRGSGVGNLQIASNSWTSGNMRYTRTRFFKNLRHPTYHQTIIEAGLMRGVLPLNGLKSTTKGCDASSPPDSCYDETAANVFLLPAGVRWLTTYHVDFRIVDRASRQMYRRTDVDGMNEYSLHLLLPFGGPEFVAANRFSGAKVDSFGAIGRAKMMVWLNGFATIDLAIGKHPYQGWMFLIGNTFPWPV